MIIGYGGRWSVVRSYSLQSVVYCLTIILGDKKLLTLILTMLYWGVPFGMFIWSIFQPAIAAYVYLVIVIVFESYIFLLDIPLEYLW